MAIVGRVASLLPSATEILCALGLEDRLVGVSHECDYPAGVVGRPVLTEPKVSAHGTSVEIHAEVERAVREGLAVYRVKTEDLRAASPDLIVTQDQCRVCAVSLDDVERATRQVLGHEVTIVSLQATCLTELWRDIARVADAAGVAQRGSTLVAMLQRRLEAIQNRTGRAEHRPRTACIEWIEPLMVAGNWVPELVRIAGGAADSLVSAGAHSAWTDWPTLVRYAPQAIVVAPCGFTVRETLRDLHRLTSRPEWASLPAVEAGRVFVMDGSAYLNRPGPRLVETTEILAHALHPGIFPAAPGDGWLCVSAGDSPVGAS
jgi:iron complex transport system substrate-binding protein